MQSRLPPKILDNETGQTYQALIADISEDKDSQTLANYICKTLATDMGLSEQARKAQVGTIFELLMAEMLLQHKITPFYRQATLLNVPLSKFDFLCYHPQKPIVFSTKFSLAERWRQTAFEGASLKQVYRHGKCYLITYNPESVKKRNDEIEDGRIFGIDKILIAGTTNLKTLLDEVATTKFCEAEPVNPIEKHTHIIREASDNR
ncbi:MAG: hypothetical protein OXT03_01655 [Alphaproteobacteria bacterium]|nr:hypothetical protein [Alphaproteobacteria bacterium]